MAKKYIAIRVFHKGDGANFALGEKVPATLVKSHNLEANGLVEVDTDDHDDPDDFTEEH